MAEKDDWRRMGQERYLKGVHLYREDYAPPRESWDHDHCEFCGVKFMLDGPEGTLTGGYTTEDRYHWICGDCMRDFRIEFEWTISEEGGDP